MSQAACLIACFATTLGCGTLYTYSAYSPQLSDHLKLSASTISAIGMVGNFSMSFSGPFAGYIVDTYGYRAPVFISILTTVLGYCTLYWAYSHVYSSVSVLALALLSVGIGSTFAFSAAVKCAAVNFPKIRGTATALTMSGYGLSAFFVSLIAQLTSGAAAETDPASGAQHVLATLAIVPAVLLVLFGPVIAANRPLRKQQAHSRTLSEEYNLDPSPSSDSLVERIIERRQEKEYSGIGLLRHKLFWLYFLILGILAGMGQAYIYTCGYMAKALVAAAANGVQDSAAPEKAVQVSQALVAPVQAHQVAVLSLANCCGRIFSGTLSDALKNNFKVSRTYSLFLAVTLCLAAMLICQRIESVELLWLPTSLVGFFYGAVFGAYPGIISDEFGVKRLSSNWGLVALAPIPFSSVMAVRIGKVYDQNSVNSLCVGYKCFRGAYPLHANLAIVALVLLLLTLKIQRNVK